MHSSCCVDPFATFIVARRRRLEDRESQLSSESVRMTFRRAPAPEVLLLFRCHYYALRCHPLRYANYPRRSFDPKCLRL